MRPICEISRAVKAIREEQDRGMREGGKTRRGETGVRWAKVGEPCPTATTWQPCDEVTRCMLNHCHASLRLGLSTDQSLCSYVEYKLQLMPIVTDNGAYDQHSAAGMTQFCEPLRKLAPLWFPPQKASWNFPLDLGLVRKIRGFQHFFWRIQTLFKDFQGAFSSLSSILQLW